MHVPTGERRALSRADGLDVSHIHLRYIWPLARNLGDHGAGARSGASAHACGEKEHVGTANQLGDAIAEVEGGGQKSKAPAGANTAKSQFGTTLPFKSCPGVRRPSCEVERVIVVSERPSGSQIQSRIKCS